LQKKSEWAPAKVHLGVGRQPGNDTSAEIRCEVGASGCLGFPRDSSGGSDSTGLRTSRAPTRFVAATTSKAASRRC